MADAVTPTEQLLLACCAVPGGGPVEAPDGVDWDRFERLAAWHRVSGAAFKALRVDRLQPVYNETLARNLAALAELDRIAGELEGAGLTALLLKGAALLRWVYDDVGTRPMLDLDLLLREPDVPRAGAVLAGLGYAAAPKFAAMSAQLWERHGRWVPLVRADGMVVVELHRNLGDLDLDGWWDRSAPTSSPALRRPSRADLLVHIARHALGDRRLRSEGALGQLRDVAHVATGDVEWERVQASGQGTALILAAVATLGLAGADFPGPAVDQSLTDELIRRRVWRDDSWVALERIGPRTTALRQLLPPRPTRRGGWQMSPRSAYAAWAGATARLVARPADVRGEVVFARAVGALLALSGRPN